MDVDSQVEAFAELLVELDAPFADRSEVLRRAGLDDTRCKQIQARWAARLTAPGAEAESLVRRFGDAYERARQALGRSEHAPPGNSQGAAAVKVAQMTDVPPVVAASPPPPEPPSFAWPAPSPATPSYLQRPDAPSPEAPSPNAVASPAIGPTLTPAMTMAIPAFSSPTANLDPVKHPLPFAPGGSQDEALTRAKEQAAARPRQPEAPAVYGETAPIDIAAIARKVLAFDPARKPLDPPSPPGPTPPSTSVSAAAGPTPAAAAPLLPALTVEQYASLCAEMEAWPAQTPVILRRYGVNAEGKGVLDEGWRRIFDEQPARRAAFERAKAAYCAWLAGGGGTR